MSFRTHKGESLDTTLQFALLLRDGFFDSETLLGNVTVIADKISGERKEDSGAFLFFALKPGPQVFAVRSKAETPYYRPTDITVTVPIAPPAPPAPQFPWPAFPDIRNADPKLPLHDPNQAVAYKAQRKMSTLLPTAAYPFPQGTTLVRGTVQHAGAPLADATVRHTGGSAPPYVTGGDGQFVLFLKDAPGIPQNVNINAKHAGFADANVNLTILRGLSVPLTIDM